MTQLIGYFANQTDRLRCALGLEGDALALGPGRTAALGVGSFQSGEVLLRRKPADPMGSSGLLEMVRDLRTGCCLAYARAATPGARSLENTQPFRHKQWLFAHTGSLIGFAEGRAALLAGVPEHLARGIRGDTESEVFFALFLAALDGVGALDDPECDGAAVVAALSEAADVVDRVCGRASGLNLLVTHGRALVALRRGQPMGWLRRQGVRDCGVCRAAHEVPGRDPRRVDHESLRYVVVAGDETPTGVGWREVSMEGAEDGVFLVVDRQLEVKMLARRRS